MKMEHEKRLEIMFLLNAQIEPILIIRYKKRRVLILLQMDRQGRTTLFLTTPFQTYCSLFNACLHTFQLDRHGPTDRPTDGQSLL